MLRITVTSVPVDDQAKALAFYTDVPVAHRRLREGPRRCRAAAGAQRAPRGGPVQAALVADGIPFTSFGVDDARAEFERLSAAAVRFVQEPVDMGTVTTAVLDDTCGNLIQIASRN